MAAPSIIDVSHECGRSADVLAAAGVRTIIRYYSRDTLRPTKRLTADEATRFGRAGVRLAIVHEARRGDTVGAFDHALGLADGQHVREYGGKQIGQPAGTTVFFAVDFDATAAEIAGAIVPYFRGVADAMAIPSTEPRYAVGVYGSGAVCKALLDAGLAELAWLAQSRGWAGFKPLLASNRWTLKQGPADIIAGVDCDPDELGAGRSLGDFLPIPAARGSSMMGNPKKRVIARSGLRLRSAPQLTSDVIVATLPFGTELFAIKQVDGWTLVDRQGDGAADGFVSSAFLEDIGPGATGAGARQGAANQDAMLVTELVHLGSTAAGLAASRKAASASMAHIQPPYPHNGCAAHLSALLQAAGIDVPTTLGAGKLAHRLEERGWARVGRGNQRPGDVGVTFDDDPSIPGADHVYLVIETFGPDRMMIADNQNSQDSPHQRFASGQGGKTPTDFFLRA